MTPMQVLSAILIFFVIGFVYGYLIGHDKKVSEELDN